MNQNTGEHVYYEYTNPNTGKTVQDYMNKWEWEAIQRSPRKVDYTLLKEINLNDQSKPAVPTADAGNVREVPVEEDPLECPLCGYVAADEDDLQEHKKEEHA